MNFFKNQIKLVKVVGVNLDKLTCATLPAAAPICKQPKVWLKQVPIVALFGPIFQLSWFSHGSSVIWCLQTLYQLLKRCGDLEKLRTTRESWNEVTSLETQHHSWRFSAKRKLLDYLPGDKSSVMDRGARLVSLSFTKYNPSTESASGKKVVHWKPRNLVSELSDDHL